MRPTIIITHISITPSAFHSIKTKKALQIDTRYKTTWPLCFSIRVCDVPSLQGSPETRSQLFMIQELISLSESSRKKRSSWKKKAQRGRVEAQTRFKTYLNPPRRLETSLTTLSPLVISEEVFFMPRQKKGGNPFWIYKWFEAELEKNCAGCFRRNISILAIICQQKCK